MVNYSNRHGDRQVAQSKPQLSAAQKALLERRVTPLNLLIHGAYYKGFLDDAPAVGRWNAHKRRFVFWEHNMAQPQSKATPHVADLGAGPRFAPITQQESGAETHVSDFALETTGTGA